MSLNLDKKDKLFNLHLKIICEDYPLQTNYLFPFAIIPDRSIVPSVLCINLPSGFAMLPNTGLSQICRSFNFLTITVYLKVGVIFVFSVIEYKSKLKIKSCPSTFLFPNGFETLPPSKSTFLPFPEFGRNYWGMVYFWIKTPQEIDLCFISILTPSTAPAGLPLLLLDPPPPGYQPSKMLRPQAFQ